MRNFEKRLERLEEISDSIRLQETQLEDAVQLFEEGIKLAKSLEKDIDKIEAKIQILTNTPQSKEDKPELDLFSASKD